MFSLDNRVVLITGGCGDIGRATVAAFLREGAVVVATDTLGSGEARATLDAGGLFAADYHCCDVRDRAAVTNVIAKVVAGRGRLDVVVANAGITRSTPILEVSPQEWSEVLDVNLSGAYHVAQEGARAMVHAGTSGALLFTGSWVGSGGTDEGGAGTVQPARCDPSVTQEPRGLRSLPVGRDHRAACGRGKGSACVPWPAAGHARGQGAVRVPALTPDNWARPWVAPAMR